MTENARLTIALDVKQLPIYVNPQEIDLHLESIPADAARLTVWYRKSPDSPGTVSSGIYDTRVDSDGLTLGRQLWCDAEGIPVATMHSSH